MARISQANGSIVLEILEYYRKSRHAKGNTIAAGGAMALSLTNIIVVLLKYAWLRLSIHISTDIIQPLS